MSESVERSVNLLVFVGTLDYWTTWEPSFITTADLKGYGKLFTVNEILMTDSAQIIKFKKNNREAYNGQFLANEIRKFISLIMAVKTV